MIPDDLLTVQEVAERLGYPSSTVHRWVRRGDLQNYAETRPARISLSEAAKLQNPRPRRGPRGQIDWATWTEADFIALCDAWFSVYGNYPAATELRPFETATGQKVKWESVFYACRRRTGYSVPVLLRRAGKERLHIRAGKRSTRCRKCARKYQDLAGDRLRICTSCRDALDAAWREKTPLALWGQWRDYTERPRGTSAHVLRYRYGLTAEQYDGMMQSQEGRCAVCRGSPDRYRLVVDHNHTTGVVRGLLCMPCNAALGRVEDTDWLANAIRYLGR